MPFKPQKQLKFYTETVTETNEIMLSWMVISFHQSMFLGYTVSFKIVKSVKWIKPQNCVKIKQTNTFTLWFHIKCRKLGKHSAWTNNLMVKLQILLLVSQRMLLVLKPFSYWDSSWTVLLLASVLMYFYFV